MNVITYPCCRGLKLYRVSKSNARPGVRLTTISCAIWHYWVTMYEAIKLIGLLYPGNQITTEISSNDYYTHYYYVVHLNYAASDNQATIYRYEMCYMLTKFVISEIKCRAVC